MQDSRAQSRRDSPRRTKKSKQDVAIEMVKIAKEGLRRRGANEENFVDGLMEIATTGKTSSDLLLEAYENEWGEDIDKVFKKLSY